MRDGVAWSARLDEVARALRLLLDVADGLTPADLPRRTPCTDYSVEQLLAHLVGWQHVFAACAADRDVPLQDGSPTYRASQNPVSDLAAASAQLVADLRSRGDRPITLPYRGTTSVDLLIDELVAETVIHTWDLAVGLGRTVEFDAELLATAHVGLGELLGESFAGQAFRPERDTSAARDELERLLMRSGRPDA